MDKTIKKYLFNNDGNLEFELLDIGKVFDIKRSLMSTPHRAQFYHIIWVEKGSGTHYIDFKPIELEDNCILFVPTNSINRFDANGLYAGKAIIFTDAFFCKNNEDRQFLRSSILFSDLYDNHVLKMSPSQPELGILLDAMESEYTREHDSEQYAILQNMLHVFLLQAERSLRLQGVDELKQSPSLDYIVSFKELLEKKFREEKSVSSYASELNLSEKQLYKAATALLDKTPKQIIDERVVLEAKRLLVHSTYSVKELAYHLGYGEPTNFIKYFKKHTGNTPSGFRQKYSS